jgi:phosphonate transport system substrate-binding protein
MLSRCLLTSTPAGTNRRGVLARLFLTISATAALSGSALAQDKLRFAVGPFQPIPTDTRKAYEPFFKYLADTLGRPFDLVVTNDWAGISVALANKQADVAWMGPWGYVLANQEGGAKAIATVKFDGKPFYHAVILGRQGLKVDNWPEGAKGLKLSLADVGSTSGWLIPTFYFKGKGIDPKTFFQYRDGASHPANVTAVATGQVDLASDYDRNFTAMVEKGIVKREDVSVVWKSDPLPNDPLVVRDGFDPAMVAKLQEAALAISEEQAKTVMPPHYTGWIKADHSSYKLIEDAGIAVGRIKPKS